MVRAVLSAQQSNGGAVIGTRCARPQCQKYPTDTPAAQGDTGADRYKHLLNSRFQTKLHPSRPCWRYNPEFTTSEHLTWSSHAGQASCSNSPCRRALLVTACAPSCRSSRCCWAGLEQSAGTPDLPSARHLDLHLPTPASPCPRFTPAVLRPEHLLPIASRQLPTRRCCSGQLVYCCCVPLLRCWLLLLCVVLLAEAGAAAPGVAAAAAAGTGWGIHTCSDMLPRAVAACPCPPAPLSPVATSPCRCCSGWPQCGQAVPSCDAIGL